MPNGPDFGHHLKSGKPHHSKSLHVKCFQHSNVQFSDPHCIHVTGKGSIKEVVVATYGTGPRACLSLFPVAELDKVS